MASGIAMSEIESRPAAERPPREVTRFEANLLRMTRGFLGGMPREQTLAIVFREHPRPKCLKRPAVELLEETLRKGVVQRLARWGWPRARFLRGADGASVKPVTGRTWERTTIAERELEFSRHTLEWLLWLTAENPLTCKTRPRIQKEQLTVGDRLVQFLAMEVLAGSVAAAPVVKLPAFAANDLLWLAWPEECIGLRNNVPWPDFTTWTRPESSWVLETLQPVLAERWGAIETAKQEIVEPARLRQIGETQAAVLDAYLGQLDTAGRWDLARFLAETVRDLLEGTAQALPWFARLRLDGLRMSDRTEVYRAGLALLHAFDRLHDWERRARGIGYLDEEYQLAQFWKGEWERLGGDLLAVRAREVVRRFELLNVS